MEQFPGGGGREHSASLVRWFVGTRPPSTPLDVPLLEDPLVDPLLDDVPLEELDALLELAELDGPPASPPCGSID
jgi:hypothetical protein